MDIILSVVPVEKRVAVLCNVERRKPQENMVKQIRSMVDVLESYGEEGRGKLRKARGRSQHPLIPRLPNGVTRPEFVRSTRAEYIGP